MEPLKEMIGRAAQPGRVAWIGVRPERRAPIVTPDAVDVGPHGIDGDHGSSGKRALTLLQAEHLAAIGSYLGRSSVPAEALRRNLVVTGLNLLAYRGRQLRLGTTEIEIVGNCAPCSRMEEAFGPGGYAAVRGHGGVTARVLVPGRISLNDAVVLCPAD